MHDYREDINGLRAIAVLLVIAFHFGLSRIGGGYIGVDVFFVISGYLIGAIVFDQLDRQRFSFTQFYFRRIRRLFPVYIVVIACTYVFAHLWLLPGDFREFGQSVVASAFYASNVLFYMEAGYFDTAAHLKPLLHTWSLSVEEQFYIVFPVAAWLSFKLKRPQFVAIFVVLTLVSLAAALLHLTQDESAVFFLYPFRAWEMFIGVLLALKLLPSGIGARGSLALSLAGLALILVPAFAYTPETPFPGLSALWPCLGTAFLLYAGASTPTLVQRALGHPVPAFIGKISYSLYLWHWPVVVLYEYVQPEPLRGVEYLALAALTLVLSVLSWRFVEAPFRDAQVWGSGRKLIVFSGAVLTSALCLAVGLLVHTTNGLPQRFSEAQRPFVHAAADIFGDLSNCQPHDNTALPGVAFCARGTPFQAARLAVVWGDSHAAAFKAGLESKLGSETSLLIAWAGGCPPLLGIEKDESVASTQDDSQCSAQNRSLFDYVVTHRERIQALMLVGRWSYYTKGGGVGVDAHNRIAVWPDGGQRFAQPSEQEVFVVESFSRTIETLRALGIEVFVVQQVPEFVDFNARRIAMELIRGGSTHDVRIQHVTRMTYASVLERQGLLNARALSLRDESAITLIETHSRFCRDGTCSAMRGDMPLFFDNNHISTYGAMQIDDMFDSFKSRMTP